MTGGGSALLPAPTPPITLAEVAKVTQLVARRGASIQQLNTIRKNLELLMLKWEEYEKGVNALISWFMDQEAKVKRCHKIGHEVTVQQGLRDCKVQNTKIQCYPNRVLGF